MRHGHEMHKGHKGRHHRNTGGRNEAEMDLHDKPKRYNESHVEDEAEERKHGGKVHHRRRRKHGGEIHGEHAKHHAGRKPRKRGGACETDPYTTAHHGSAPKGRKLDMEME